MKTVTETFYDKEQKIWSGSKKKDFYGPEVTLGEVALTFLSRCPNKVVQIMDTTGEELTASRFIQQSKLIANNFMNFGFKVGDVIGISGNNTTYLTSVILGAYLCGTPIHALYPGFDKENVGSLFKITQPKIIFCDIENYETMLAAKIELDLKAEIYLLNGEKPNVRNVKELLIDNPSQNLEEIEFPCVTMNGDDTAAILCTSGTTGISKGTCCSHRALLNMQIFTTLKADSVLCTFTNLYWGGGLFTLTASIVNGVKRIITDKIFTVEYFLGLVEKYQITHLLCNLHHMALLMENAPEDINKRLSSVDTIVCGGAKIPKNISEQINNYLGIKPRVGFAVAYGLSELSAALTMNDGGPLKRRHGTEGKLLPNREAKIIDKDTGKALGPNERGILYIRTPYKWSGYFNNDVATKKTTHNGWLVTGDIAYFDDDGYLNICGRDNDVFRSNNFQISPEQIEGVIMQLPGVLEACVFGIPDFVATNLTACAVVRTNNEFGENLTAEDIIEHVSKNLPEMYHIKAGVFFLKTLPKTGSGKVVRRKVIEIIEGNKYENCSKN